MPRLIRRLFNLMALAALPVAAAGGPAPAHPAAALVQRGLAAMRADPEVSRRLADEALQALAERPDADLEVRARLLRCDYFAERDAARAGAEIAAARRVLPQARRPALQAGLLSCEGEVAETSGDYARARERFDEAAVIAERHGDPEMLGDVLYQRGYLRGVQGEYAAGLADLRQARRLFEQQGLAARATTVLNGIAILYNRLGDHEQARHFYEQTLQALKLDGSQRELAVTQHNLGRVYENLHQWPQAREAFQAALDGSRALQYPRGEAYALRGLASVRNAEGRPADALALLEQAERLQQATTDERLRGQILLQRGVALGALKRTGEAMAPLEQALQVFRRVESLQEMVATQQALAVAAATAGDWKAAFEQQQGHTQSLERWLRGQLDQRFATLKVEFDTASKERENQLLLREKAATESALAQAQRASRLQVVAIGLAGALLVALGLLVMHERRSKREVHRLALTDELTGLPNRRDALKRVHDLLADRRAAPCALLILDLDHFKQVNDEYGHLVGDELLKAVAGVLRRAVAAPGCPARLGGEEFVVVLPETGEAQAMAAAEAIRSQVEALDAGRWMHGQRQLTASLGFALSRPGRDSVSSLLHRADEALYRAKAAGRNRVFAEAA